MEIVKINNGYVLITNPQQPDAWFYCASLVDVHKEIDFILSVPTPPPLPPEEIIKEQIVDKTSKEMKEKEESEGVDL